MCLYAFNRDRGGYFYTLLLSREREKEMIVSLKYVDTIIRIVPVRVNVEERDVSRFVIRSVSDDR